MLQLARSRASNRTVLSDEGTIGIASLLFCAPDLDLRPAELARFAQLAPLPDRIVYVRAPIASLVRRATSRRDPRRPLTRMRANQVEPMVRRTVDVFEGLAAAPQLRGRLVAVENADRKPADREEQLREIASGLRPFLAPAVAAELPVALGGRSPLQGELGP
jgi:thymidylate kinase